MSKFQGMSDEYLRKNYVPDVYQPSIYAIDYQKLKDAGIKFISFDIDDTIADLLMADPPKEAITLFENLKGMGFELMLLTNAWDSRAKNFAEKLGIKDRCIARAEKPLTTHFKTMQDRYGLEKNQMAHVGNSMRDDIAGGNAFEITTCLVRRAGVTGGLGKRIPGVKTEGQKLREELLKRGIWRKHHKDVKGDQYYQLGELPQYRLAPANESSQENIAEAAAADLITKVNADKDKTYTLEELQRNVYKENESEGMKTLRTHLGEDIVFTGVLADAIDGRELEESELLEGELSAFVFTIGGYELRDSACLYRDDPENNICYAQRIPAGPEEIAEYRKRHMNGRYGRPENGFRDVEVLSARYKGAASDAWTFVCLAATSVSWDESIDFICTVKYEASDPDEKEMLFVLNQYTGNSFGVAHWYRMSSDGTVTDYEEHPYDPESYVLSWKDSDSGQDEVTVTTPKELKKAIEEKRDRIIVTGELAKKVRKSKKIKKLSPAILAMIGGLSAAAAVALAAVPAATVLAPGAGGAAAFAVFATTAAPAAAASGLSIPTLLVISAVGLASMSLLFDEYTNIDVEAGKLIFERRRKSKD